MLKPLFLLSSLILFRAQAHEWAASFDLTSGSYTWRSQKTGCPLSAQSYAEETMNFVVLSLPNSTAPGLESAHEIASSVLDGSNSPLVPRLNGEALAVGIGYTLTFDQNSPQTLFPITIISDGAYGIFTEHNPAELEFDAHYLFDSNEVDVEPVVVDGEGEEHEHGHSEECVPPTSLPDCECTNAGPLDCGDTTKVTEAFETLEANSCNSGCNCYDPVCRDAFFIVDMYHSGCDADDVPAMVETNFHNYEGSCQSCFIRPYQNPALPQCTPATCEEPSAAISNFTLLQDLNCSLSQCQDEPCKSAWRVVISHHDSCCESDVPEMIEDGFHDFEESCLGGCNIVFEENYVVDCAAPKNAGLSDGPSRDDDDNDEKLSTGEVIAIVVPIVVVVCAVGFALLYYCYLKPQTEDETRKAPAKLEESKDSSACDQASIAGNQISEKV